MKLGGVNRSIPAAAAALGVAAVLGWVWARPPVPEIKIRVPGQDNVAAQAAAAATDLRGTFAKGEGTAADLPGIWPNFRGPKLDNISPETVPLTRKWKGAGPTKLWSVELGEGYAGPAVANGRVYLLDYDAKARADVLRCLSLADGKEIWRRGYSVDITRNHGISRTVPAVADNAVVTLGPKCHVLCVDATSGDFKWGIDLVREYKTKVPLWYAGQCPLIDGGNVILAPGGESLMIAVDLQTGQVKWKTPNPRRWDMTHSTISAVNMLGRKMYVYCGTGGVVGVSAEDGTILWESMDWRIATNVPAPIQVEGNRIFVSGYEAGCMMLQLAEVGGKIVASPQFTRPAKVFGSDQHTPLLYQGHLYSVIAGGQLVCMDLSGKVVWTSGGKHRFGLGPFMIADGMIIVMNDSGLLTLAEASAAGFKVIAQAPLFEEGRDAWGPFALVGGRLLAREMTRMVCVDLRRTSYE